MAYAAALRLTRFHTQNDHGDWDVVHHGFTTANAVHQMVLRNPTPEIGRAIYQGAMKVFLDRFLNVPAARLPGGRGVGDEPAHLPELSDLQACFDREGMVDEAGAIVYGWLRSGRDAELGRPCPRALPCLPRTLSSTGSRRTKQRSARRTRGLPVRNSKRSS